MKIEFHRPIPPQREPHPIRKIMDELKLAPIGASVVIPAAERRRAALYMSGDWCIRYDTEDGDQIFQKVAEPFTRGDTLTAAEDREGDIHLPEVAVDETSAEPEARVTTQADEVKPEEGDINLPEEIVDEDMGFLDEPEPLSIDELVRSGTMLTEDERAMRIGILSGRIEQHAQQKIASRYDANARADMLRDIKTYIDRGALGLDITPTQLDAFTRANAMNAWITATETHARVLREGLSDLSLEMLRVYDLDAAGWPT